jgi:hypothetical protein
MQPASRAYCAQGDVIAAQPDGSTALHWAAYHGDAATAALLLAAGACLNAAMDTGMTPLVLACEAGNAELVKALLHAGADVNQTLSGGETRLMGCAHRQRPGAGPAAGRRRASGCTREAARDDGTHVGGGERPRPSCGPRSQGTWC